MVWLLLGSGERRLAAAAPFYGPFPADGSITGSKAAVLAVYGGLDDRVNATRDAAQAALEAARLKHKVVTFTEAGHAFFNDTGARFDRGGRGEASPAAGRVAGPVRREGKARPARSRRRLTCPGPARSRARCKNRGVDVPVFIVVRDRVESLAQLVAWLERAGCERIHLVDNASEYPPLLEHLERTPHDVIRLDENQGAFALWRSVLPTSASRAEFVCSDPDVVPIEECPLDAIDYFSEILDRYPAHTKAGFGLRIDDLPEHYSMRDEVRTVERYNWERPLAPRLYDAFIDTTFALYRGPEAFDHVPAVRTGYPYLARHTTWYLDEADLPGGGAFLSRPQHTHAVVEQGRRAREARPAGGRDARPRGAGDYGGPELG